MGPARNRQGTTVGKDPLLLRASSRRSRDYPNGYEAVELDMLQQLAHRRKLHKDEC